MGRNFEVQPPAEKNFYLRLTIENMYAFAVFANKYLHPCGSGGTSFTTMLNF